VEAIKQLLQINRGYIYEIPYNEYVLVLFSGGMDSCVLIDFLIRNWKCKVILLYFRRGSKNEIWEQQAVDYFFDFYKQRFSENMISCIKIDLQIPLRQNKEFFNRTRQKFFGLPLRNTTMWTNAFTQAVFMSGKYNATIRTLIVGSIKEDETSPESGILSILSGSLHYCICMGVWYYQILAPYLDGSLGKVHTKFDIVEYAHQYQIPIAKSRSCFEATQEPCGKCLACENRNQAFAQFQLKNNITL
jgi:7-cyano-7-deazaguanine synthase in queuosine biosynthesis